VTESLSDYFYIGQNVQNLQASPEFDTYSKVVIYVGTDEDGNEIVYEAGNNRGRTLELSNPWGTQTMANNILAALSARKFAYQPFTAEDAIINPATELGDAVGVGDIYSGIYAEDWQFGQTMLATVKAPEDEEIDHEYVYIPAEEREFKRAIAESKAAITLTATQIASEVTRATAAEGTLSSRITQTATSLSSTVSNVNSVTNRVSTLEQTATSISATVSRKVDAEGGTTSRFGWSLTADGFYLRSGGRTDVFSVDTSGNATIRGIITATGGLIGGFTIGNSAIYNGMTSRDDTTHNGVYVGTNGIACGKSAFKVTSSGAVTASNLTLTGGSITLGSAFNVTSSGAVTASNLKLTGGSITLGNNFSVSSSGAVTAKSIAITGGSIAIGNNFTVTSAGNVTANNMVLTGTLTVGGSRITAANLYTGASKAYANHSSWTTGANWVSSNGSYTKTGAGYGYNFDSMKSGTSSTRYPINASTLLVAGTQYVRRTISFLDYYGNTRTWTVLATP